MNIDLADALQILSGAWSFAVNFILLHPTITPLLLIGVAAIWVARWIRNR